MGLEDGEAVGADANPEARVGALVDGVLDGGAVAVDLPSGGLRRGVGDAQLLGAHAQVDGAAGLDVLVVEADDRLEVGEGELAVLLVDAVRDLAVEEVGVADERGDERGAGRLVDLGGGVDLLDAALVHDGDAVAQRHGLALVVGDVEEGDADLVVDEVELDLHVLAQLQVERGERLVEQQHLRVVDERPGDRDALLLPAADLVGLLVLVAVHLDEVEHGVDFAVDLLARLARDAQAEGDVVADAQVREQRVVLEHGVDAAHVRRQARDVAPVEEDAAGVRLLEAGEDAQQRRLAAAAGAEQGVELAALDLQARVVDGREAAEALGDVFENEKLRHVARPPRRRGGEPSMPNLSSASFLS